MVVEIKMVVPEAGLAGKGHNADVLYLVSGDCHTRVHDRPSRLEGIPSDQYFRLHLLYAS